LGFLYGTGIQLPEPVTDNWQAYMPAAVEEPAQEEINSPSQLLVIVTDEVLNYKTVDAFCLAKNIYHEARSEDLLGQMAVAQVTLNRLQSERYPSTICNVVMQRKQFSWANNRAIRWTHPKGRLWEASKALATQFLDKGVRVSGLETALFYHADYVNPKWRDDDKLVAQVGVHLFYEDDKKL
jgi:spore germination cell wall hydrolase CwlJ-like protein